jgi:hypothetical protein
MLGKSIVGFTVATVLIASAGYASSLARNHVLSTPGYVESAVFVRARVAGFLLAMSEQDNWRWCNERQVLAFAGYSLGACAAGGSHDHYGSGFL